MWIEITDSSKGRDQFSGRLVEWFLERPWRWTKDKEAGLAAGSWPFWEGGAAGNWTPEWTGCPCGCRIWLLTRWTRWMESWRAWGRQRGRTTPRRSSSTPLSTPSRPLTPTGWLWAPGLRWRRKNWSWRRWRSRNPSWWPRNARPATTGAANRTPRTPSWPAAFRIRSAGTGRVWSRLRGPGRASGGCQRWRRPWSWSCASVVAAPGQVQLHLAPETVAGVGLWASVSTCESLCRILCILGPCLVWFVSQSDMTPFLSFLFATKHALSLSLRNSRTATTCSPVVWPLFSPQFPRCPHPGHGSEKKRVLTCCD